MTETIHPFRIAVDEAVLQDLQARLQRTRWPEAETVAGSPQPWSQGVPLSWLQPLMAHWASGYDWRQREALLNRWPQFVTAIDGLDVHFVHVRSPHADALPLVMTHGWPGSMVEFQQVLGPLTDPTAHGGRAEDAFHLVCPSLPGFGFSGKPGATGWGTERIANAWAQLMQRLAYGRYGAQGGDWGSAVTRAIGVQDPAHCAGIHVTLAMGNRPDPETPPSDADRRALKGLQHYRDWDSGYSQQQATRPQTLGYGLCDSPVGQAAWILEKFWAWTDHDGDPLSLLDRDALLDNVMLYWATNSAASSARLYWESFRPTGSPRAPVTVPTGVAVFPKEIVAPVRRWMTPDFPNIQHWTEMPRGGHFAAFEQPALLIDDVQAFFRPLRPA